MDWIYKKLFTSFLNKIQIGTITIFSSETKEIIFNVVRTNDYVAKICVKDSDMNLFIKTVIKKSDIGFCELYMKGIWWSPDVFSVMMTLIANKKYLRTITFNLLSNSSDEENIKHHYDVGNDFYMQWLTDDLHAYTCGFFFSPNDTLNTAQYNKVHTIIKKLDIKPNEDVLDIGCGWGTIANHIRENTHANVDGVTISEEQYKFIKQNHPSVNVFNVNIFDMPTDKKYDKIYSIGAFEHFKGVNYGRFFTKVNDLLKPGGRLVLHTMVHTTTAINSTINKQADTYITKYIFPGNQIPEHYWIMDSATDSKLNSIHVEYFGGYHYHKTLLHWNRNMMEQKQTILSLGYTEELIRLYELYFLGVSATFATNQLCIGQYIFEKKNDVTDIDYSFLQQPTTLQIPYLTNSTNT